MLGYVVVKNKLNHAVYKIDGKPTHHIQVTFVSETTESSDLRNQLKGKGFTDKTIADAIDRGTK